ncbi:MAG TPA: amidohydrolase [Methanospirillum sp.]|nr:amidohydrolase [Methanospirillum sp.]
MTANSSDIDIFSGKGSVLITGTRLGTDMVDLFIDDTGAIQETGAGIASRYRSEADHIIDGSGTLVLPGLVNAHTHAAMTLLRGYADDMHLQQWLSEKIWPLEAHLTGEDVYWGTKLACLEMIRSGTIAFNDMYFFMEDAARAVDESGIRAVLSHGFITFGSPEKFEAEVKATERLVSHIRAMNNPRILPAVGPHAPYTVPPDHLKWCGEFSRDENIMLHIHLSETRTEVEDCQAAHGVKPASLLDQCGCLSPRTVAAHGCWLDEEECRLLAARGSHVAHNPVSNLKLATGRVMPYPDLRSAGVNTALATDGCSSNNNLDLFEEMKVAAISQKFFWNQDTLLPAQEALDMATIAGARALNIPGGRIAPGQAGDIILLSLRHPSMVPLYNPVSNVVYAASGSLVQTVLCNGRVLMHEGFIPGEEDILAGAAGAAASLLHRSEPVNS